MFHTEDEIRNEIAALTQNKAEAEKFLKDRQSELEPLLADQALDSLGSGTRAKIETLRKNIEAQKATIAHINESLPGLAKKLEEAKAAAPEIKRLIKALRNSDLDILKLMRGKFVVFQDALRAEAKMNDAFIDQDKIREKCKDAGFNPKGFPEAYQIPLNLLMMNITQEFIAKFLPLDDQSLPEAIAVIEKIIREVELGHIT